ncbi:MAG: SGNH/GDSL hydrolase family protein [Cyanobacteria bacterium P01_D01_bin.1]
MTTGAVSELSFDQIFFFGDSLSDSGNISELTSDLLLLGLPPEGFGYNQNFTNAEADGNGAMWTEEVPALLGITADDTANFAFGAARVLGSVTIASLLQPGAAQGLLRPGVDLDNFSDAVLSAEARAVLAESEVLGKLAIANDLNLTGQIANALASVQGQFSSGTAVSFLIGGNDYSDIAPGQDVQAFITNLVTTILGNAAQVAAAGADTLIYVAQPALSFAPISQQFVLSLIEQGLSEADAIAALTQLDQLVGIQNQQVSAGFQALGQQFGIEIEIVDLDQLAEEIQTDLSGFGFKFAGSRILTNGADALPFQDFNNNGIPDVGIDPDTNDILDLPFPFISTDIDGDDQDDIFVATQPESLAFDLDEITFFDGLHPSAATHDLIANFYLASLTQDVSFLTAAADAVSGTEAENLIFAKAGDDITEGKRANDVIFGGLGNDTLSGNKGEDIVVGGAGNDLLIGNLGTDIVAGSDGDDRLLGRRGNDLLIGGSGNDEAIGGSGDDLFIQKLDMDPAFDIIRGGLGDDTLFLEVDGSSFDAVQSSLTGFRAGRRFQLSVGSREIEIYSIEQVVLGNSDNRAQFGQAYAQSLGGLDADAIALVDTAARWNQLDPISQMS